MIIFIVGSNKSGKSSYVLKLAIKNRKQKSICCHSTTIDEEMKEKISRYEGTRGREGGSLKHLKNLWNFQGFCLS